jgi:DNA-binding transcriptional regulator YdaS (Cro superfamily)
VAVRVLAKEMQARLLKRAIDICGGWNAVCARLGVNEHQLAAWLEGSVPLPPRVLLKAADIVLEDDIAWAAQDRRAEPRRTTAVSSEPR